MSAADNLNPRQFFHGSRAQLSVGDMIEPGHPGKWAVSDPRYVCFTPDMNTAHGFARRVNSRGDGGQPKVYTVEPTGKYTKDPGYEGPAFRSRQPLRITAVRDGI